MNINHAPPLNSLQTFIAAVRAQRQRAVVVGDAVDDLDLALARLSRFVAQHREGE